MITPYEGYVEVCEELAARHPRHARQEVRAVQLRLRGRRERGQDRPARHRPHRDRGVRPRLPRPHQPDDGADRQEHALQGGLRPVRRPRSTGCRCPTRTATAAHRRAGRGPGHRHHHHPGRRGQRRRRADRADPGRGRLHRARRRFPAGDRGLVQGQRRAADRRRDPDRLLPHRRLVRLRPRGRRARPDHHSPRASPAGCRWPPSPAAPSSWTPCTPAASAAPTAATRSPARPRSAPSGPCASSTWSAPPRPSRRP